MENAILRRGLIVGIIALLAGACIAPHVNAGIDETSKDLGGRTDHRVSYHSILDYYYIKDITKTLSYIVFSYNESQGEIARGREFGSSGERKAARILWENMTKLGLWTYNQSIGGATPWRPSNLLVSRVEVVDYKLTIHDNKNNSSFSVVCFPVAANFGTQLRPWKLTRNISYTNLKITQNFSSGDEGKVPYMTISGPADLREILTTLDSMVPKSTSNIGEFNDLKDYLNRVKDYYTHPLWKGSISYDFNYDEHNMWNSQSLVPKFSINGSIGSMLAKNMDNYTVDFYLNQRLNLSVNSYNVIGQLNGTDTSKTVMVCCLYDSWWCQGTGDSAIGMAIVMGIAKYYTDHNITPKYTMKFIGFGGEEYGMRGSKYYQATHRCENIVYIIDLNQLGFTQVDPRLNLEIAANNRTFLETVWEIAQRTNYTTMTHNTTDINPVFMEYGHNSDDRSFASVRPNASCKTVCFLKNGSWLMHHRDGLNHTAGDVFSYFNSTDVNATGDIIVNVTLNLTNGSTVDMFTQINTRTRTICSPIKLFLLLERRQ
jgi:hypothetical protein